MVRWAAGNPTVGSRRAAAALVGNDVYNLDGTNQTRTANKGVGTSVSFYVSIQNDGNANDTFKLALSGAATTMYSVRYYHGTTEITAAVVAGTYQTPSVAPGASYTVKAVVKVKSTATAGSSVSRLLTITSVANGTKQDAVKFVVKRA